MYNYRVYKITYSEYFLYKAVYKEYRLQSMYNQMVGLAASVVSPFYSILLGLSSKSVLHIKWQSRINMKTVHLPSPPLFN